MMDGGKNLEWPHNASATAKRPLLDASAQNAEAKRPRLLRDADVPNDLFPDDVKLSLKEIWKTNNEMSIVETMRDLQEIYNNREVASDFIYNLKCLRLLKLGDTIEFETEWIQDYFEKECVIASWSWEASEYESKEAGRCFIDDSPIPSTVRNCVWTRAASYMQYVEVERLWIDAECIKQDDEQMKEQAMDEMDSLYHRGSHPLGLLTRSIENEDELRLLVQIFQYDMLESSGNPNEFSLKKGTTKRAGDAVQLLRDITLDRWWNRAWIYQENYHGGDWMDLLMPHNPELETNALKTGHAELFGCLKGELVIQSIRFSEALTHLCRAFMRSFPPSPQIGQVREILSTAGLYTVLLQREKSMSPTLIADVGKRGVCYHPDRVPIIANCCSYNLRPDMKALMRKRCSYSLVILASFLINGEIFKVRPDRMPRGKKGPHELTVIEFIRTYAFDRFSPPEQFINGPTFNKSCRFPWASIRADGVHTSGHLWKLCPTPITIETQQYDGPYVVQKTLWGLLEHLEESEYVRTLDPEGQLASKLEDLLSNPPEPTAENYMWEMAEALVYALQKGQTLRLGYLCESPGGPDFSPPTGIFIQPARPLDSGESYVFTSFGQRKTSREPGYSWDVDKHVSLRVWGNSIQSRLPSLEAREWQHGLWFKTRAPREVVFPLLEVLSKMPGQPPYY